ncbi:MAG: glyoxalase [Hyphomicrobiales bacterium]|nr:glyoxalase [Hyphomicrobiales bacterium]
MKVKRIVADLHADDLPKAMGFYRDILGLEVVMDHGWIVTLGSPETMTVQISLACEGGSGAPTPDLSVEVDEIEAALARVTDAGLEIEYGPVTEPWGVRRFFVRDPLGKLINILSHV